MEVLTAYVRQHSPWPPKEAQQVVEDAVVEKKSEEDLRGKSETTEVLDLAADIQAIITVIRRRTRYYGYGEPDNLDLHETNLYKANLYEANLFGANLFGANLFGAYLWGANLSGNVLLSEANLFRASLVSANLEGALLSKANLSKANLSGANLSYADLYEANLSGAFLTEANLFRANLVGANLVGGANLTQEQLEKTNSGDENTQLPPHLKPPAHWFVKPHGQIEVD